MFTHAVLCHCIYIHTYIPIQRKGETAVQTQTIVSLHTHIRIYTYICWYGEREMCSLLHTCAHTHTLSRSLALSFLSQYVHTHIYINRERKRIFTHTTPLQKIVYLHLYLESELFTPQCIYSVRSLSLHRYTYTECCSHTFLVLLYLYIQTYIHIQVQNE